MNSRLRQAGGVTSLKCQDIEGTFNLRNIVITSPFSLTCIDSISSPRSSSLVSCESLVPFSMLLV